MTAPAVSIHAPARGATDGRFQQPIFQLRFNPRARAGRDPIRRTIQGKGIGFNPRARAGRDTYTLMDAPPMQGFNPRARAGRDIDRLDS